MPQIRATNIRAEGTQMKFTVETSKFPVKPFEIQLNLPGMHNVLNALAAIGVSFPWRLRLRLFSRH